MYVQKQIKIDKSPKEVYEQINNFNNWNAWSPWRILEKEIQEKVSDDAKYYEWIGDLSGQGNMKITEEKENESVLIDLTFLKPFKSKAKVNFKIIEVDGGSNVTWGMESSFPFFLFFMKKAMEVYIGLDFDRGLMLLKDVVEDGKANCSLDFNPNGSYPGGKFVGIRAQMSTADAPKAMERDFTKLMEWARNQSDVISGNPLTIYNNWNLVKQQADFISAVPVHEIPSNLPEGFISGELPKVNTYVVRSVGPYHHIGNAWTAIEMRARGKKFLKNKSIKPMEVYLNSIRDTAPNDLVTEIHMPRK